MRGGAFTFTLSCLFQTAYRKVVAERVGFEPTVEFPRHTLSKRAPSTARTSLRGHGSHGLQASLSWAPPVRRPGPRTRPKPTTAAEPGAERGSGSGDRWRAGRPICLGAAADGGVRPFRAGGLTAGRWVGRLLDRLAALGSIPHGPTGLSPASRSPAGSLIGPGGDGTLSLPPADRGGRLPSWTVAGRSAARILCNLSLRTASGPEGSSAK